MRVGFPRTDQPIAQAKPEPPDREWLRFLRDVWSALGFSVAVPVYSDLWIDAHATHSVAPATVTINGDVEGVLCSASALEERFFSFRLPNNYMDGTALQPYFEWAPSTSASGDVIWSLDYTKAASTETFGAATALSATEVAPGTAFYVKRRELTSISGTGLVRGSIIACVLSRHGADAGDTYGGNAIFLGAGLKYQIEGVGHERAQP